MCSYTAETWTAAQHQNQPNCTILSQGIAIEMRTHTVLCDQRPSIMYTFRWGTFSSLADYLRHDHPLCGYSAKSAPLLVSQESRRRRNGEQAWFGAQKCKQAILLHYFNAVSAERGLEHSFCSGGSLIAQLLTTMKRSATRIDRFWEKKREYKTKSLIHVPMRVLDFLILKQNVQTSVLSTKLNLFMHTAYTFQSVRTNLQRDRG